MILNRWERLATTIVVLMWTVYFLKLAVDILQ